MTGPAWLFCPADRPDRFAKAAERSDVVVLDLEDAVSPERKPAARAAVAAADLDPERTVLRINAAGTPDHELDLALLERLRIDRVMLPKAEEPAAVRALGQRQVVVLIESPLGVERAGRLAAVENVTGVFWGAEDLLAGLGGSGSRFPDGSYRDVARYARARVLVAAKAHGRLALDAVHLDIPDLSGLRAECEDAVASGFDATVAIHPSHVPVIRAAYAPTPEQLGWARDLLAAAAGRAGVFSYQGRMVDGPILRQAERIVARA